MTITGDNGFENLVPSGLNLTGGSSFVDSTGHNPSAMVASTCHVGACTGMHKDLIMSHLGREEGLAKATGHSI